MPNVLDVFGARAHVVEKGPEVDGALSLGLQHLLELGRLAGVVEISETRRFRLKTRHGASARSLRRLTFRKNVLLHVLDARGFVVGNPLHLKGLLFLLMLLLLPDLSDAVLHVQLRDVGQLLKAHAEVAVAVEAVEESQDLFELLPVVPVGALQHGDGGFDFRRCAEAHGGSCLRWPWVFFCDAPQRGSFFAVTTPEPKSFPVEVARPVSLQRFVVLLGTVPLMFGKPVSFRVGQRSHDRVAVHFGDDRGGRDGTTLGVALVDGLLGQPQIGNAYVPVDEHTHVGRGQLEVAALHGLAHGAERGAQNSLLVHLHRCFPRDMHHFGCPPNLLGEAFARFGRESLRVAHTLQLFAPDGQHDRAHREVSREAPAPDLVHADDVLALRPRAALQIERRRFRQRYALLFLRGRRSCCCPVGSAAGSAAAITAQNAPLVGQSVGVAVAHGVWVVSRGVALGVVQRRSRRVECGQPSSDNVLVLHRFPPAVSPSVGAPAIAPLGETADGVFAVRHDDHGLFLAHDLNRARNGHEFAALVGRVVFEKRFSYVARIFFPEPHADSAARVGPAVVGHAAVSVHSEHVLGGSNLNWARSVEK